MPGSVKGKTTLDAYLETLKSPDPLFGDVQRHVIQAAGHDHRRTDVLHPSEMVKADWCHRASVHKLKGAVIVKEPTSFTRENIFQNGHDVHRRWQRWLSDMGRLAGDWKCLACSHRWWEDDTPNECPECVAPYACIEYDEVHLNAHPLRISGKSDGYCPADGCLIEIKTMGIGSLRYEMPEYLERFEVTNGTVKGYDLTNMWRSLNRPLPAAVKQAQLYMYLARHFEDLPVEFIEFIYENKPTQEAKSFQLPYDESVGEPYIDAAQAIVKCIEDDYMPFCNVAGRSGCKQCKPFEDKT